MLSDVACYARVSSKIEVLILYRSTCTFMGAVVVLGVYLLFGGM